MNRRRILGMAARIWTVVMAAFALGTTVSAAPANQESEEYWKPAQKAIADLGDGFLVWESRREDDTWAIWTVRLDGTGLRRLTPRDGRFHNAAHISPDGKRVVYISRPKGDPSQLPEAERKSPLHLINMDGSGDHVIVPDAQMYGWPRVAVWFNDNELAYIDPAGNTYRLNLTTGESKPLYLGGGLWLPNVPLTHMAACFSTFCPYDAKEQKITGLPSLGGCQPYFTQDGKWGFWMHGGEEVARMNLATRIIAPIITGHGMPDDRDHLYCPMISDNNMLLAFVGCNSKKLIAGDGGGYFGCSLSSYKVFVVRLDPNTLETIAPPVRYTFDVPCDRFPDVWQATPAFGYRSDKAPYTLELTTAGLSAQAKWDFGDGATDSGAVGKHTYDKPGVYVVKVVDGDKDLRGLVRVGEPKPPKAIGAIVENEKEIVALFDEPVEVKDATVSLESGGKIERWQAAEDKRSLRVFLPARPTKNDGLLLDNITDRAQHPHRMEKTRLLVQASPWPTNRKGLAFVWETGDKANTVKDPISGQLHTYGLVGRWWSWTDHDRALVMNGGMASFFGMGESFNNSVRRTKGFTFEITITPRDVATPKQHISSYGLWQYGNKLVFECPPDKMVDLGVVEANQRYHLVLTYEPGRLIGYINGQEVLNTDAEKDPLEGGWPGMHMELGGDLNGRAWFGTVEGVALYDRALGPDEAKANYAAQQAILKARKPVPRLEVDAKLVAGSKVPTPQEAAPYLRAFSVFEYEIEKIVRGEYKPKKIRVAHWVVLDREPTPMARLPIGDQAHLILEPFADNRQLAEDTITDTLESNPDLPMYFCVQDSWQDTHRIPEWKMVGRFEDTIKPVEGTTNEGLEARNWVAPQEIDGLRNVVKTYTPKANQAWKIGKPDAKGQVNMGELPQGGSLGYAVVYVKCPTDRKGFLSVGSTFRTKTWLNGECVLDVPNYDRYPFFGYRRGPAQLKKGWNEVLIRVGNLHAFFSFACDVLDSQGKGMTDLEFATEPGQ